MFQKSLQAQAGTNPSGDKHETQVSISTDAKQVSARHEQQNTISAESSNLQASLNQNMPSSSTTSRLRGFFVRRAPRESQVSKHFIPMCVQSQRDEQLGTARGVTPPLVAMVQIGPAKQTERAMTKVLEYAREHSGKTTKPYASFVTDYLRARMCVSTCLNLHVLFWYLLIHGPKHRIHVVACKKQVQTAGQRLHAFSVRD